MHSAVSRLKGARGRWLLVYLSIYKYSFDPNSQQLIFSYPKFLFGGRKG